MNAGQAIQNLWQGSSYEGESWSGYLFRAGPSGIFYHTDPEGAGYYAGPHHPEHPEFGRQIQAFKFPQVNNPIIINFDHMPGDPNLQGITTIGLLGLEEILGLDTDDPTAEHEDPALLIEKALPYLRKMGHDAVIIYGETGAKVTGVPIEFVYFGSLERVDDPEIIASLMDQ